MVWWFLIKFTFWEHITFYLSDTIFHMPLTGKCILGDNGYIHWMPQTRDFIMLCLPHSTIIILPKFLCEVSAVEFSVNCMCVSNHFHNVGLTISCLTLSWSIQNKVITVLFYSFLHTNAKYLSSSISKNLGLLYDSCLFFPIISHFSFTLWPNFNCNLTILMLPPWINSAHSKQQDYPYNLSLSHFHKFSTWYPSLGFLTHYFTKWGC
jgi:hypothetical protein